MTLGALIQEWADKPFGYGTLDCCQFAGAIYENRTGINPMRAFEYASQAEAYRIIKEFGSLRRAIIATIGPPIPVAEALHGDLLLVHVPSPAIGVLYLGKAVARTKDGLRDFDLSVASEAWPCRRASQQ